MATQYCMCTSLNVSSSHTAKPGASPAQQARYPGAAEADVAQLKPRATGGSVTKAVSAGDLGLVAF